MLRELFPPDVAVVWTRGELQSCDDLFPIEESALKDALPTRRREFAAGRACARDALQQLGYERSAIPVLPSRAPHWPDGVVGSITHCAGLTAAAAAPAERFLGIGLDAEAVGPPLRDNVVRLICTEYELQRIGTVTAPALCPRLVFSAKEAVYKAVEPASGVWLGFHDVELDFDVNDGAFTARLVRAPDDRLPDFRHIVGRYIIRADVIATSVTIAARLRL